MVPLEGHRGIDVVGDTEASVVFETGTVDEEWKIVNADAWGPKGENVGSRASEAILDVPSEVWVVVTRRGLGNGEAMLFLCFGYDLYSEKIKLEDGRVLDATKMGPGKD